MNVFNNRNALGFSLVEIMLTLAIAGGVLALFVMNLSGLKSIDKADQAVQAITTDLLQMRSMALSKNVDYRINFLTTSSWRLERNDLGTWVVVTDTRYMPSQTYLTSATFANAGLNLWATPRGLYTFNNGAIGTPFVTVTGIGVTQTRSLNVYVGGAIEKVTP